MSSELYKPMDIKGRVVLITGASSGIGEACAWRFAEAGCRLVLLARREDRLSNLADKLKHRYKAEVHTLGLDVRDLAAVSKLPETLPEGFREVDILVANAGLALGTSPIQEVDVEDVRVMLDVNVGAVAAFLRAFTPGMLARQRGHVITMSSVAGHEAYGGGSIYCATKFAVDAMTTAARHDLVGSPVRVTAISPGAVNTEFSTVRFRGDKQAADAVYRGIKPLLAEDIADNVLYSATRPAHV